MRLEKQLFDKLATGLKEAPRMVHAKDAKLFAGKKGTSYEPFVETTHGGHVIASYLIYATICGKTLPIEPSIIPSMLDFSGCGAEPCDAGSQKFIPRECACAMAHSAIDSVIDKPIEVLAIPSEGTKDNRSKWNIWMLRDGNDNGFIHDAVVRVLGGK